MALTAFLVAYAGAVVTGSRPLMHGAVAVAGGVPVIAMLAHMARGC